MDKDRFVAAMFEEGERMKQESIEITRLDPKRWALLHVPFGLGLGILGTIMILKETGFNSDGLFAL
ncbi:MAG: hypothetical protein PF495_14065, partial [Spirochaetales bacterium]|nr:hypothetical protein [Spirochaetales bacterium]